MSSTLQTHKTKRRSGIFFYIIISSPLEYVKGLVQSLVKGSKADQYIVQNLTWSGVYLRSTLSNDLLQKVLTLVPLTATGPEVYVAIMTTIISDYYYSLVDTLNH